MAAMEEELKSLREDPHESVDALLGQARRLVGKVEGDRAVSLAESIAEVAATTKHKLKDFYKEALRLVKEQEASPDLKSLLVSLYGSADAQKASNAYTAWKKTLKIEGRLESSAPAATPAAAAAAAWPVNPPALPGPQLHPQMAYAGFPPYPMFGMYGAQYPPAPGAQFPPGPPRRRSTGSKKRGNCFTCGKPGHHAAECKGKGAGSP